MCCAEAFTFTVAAVPVAMSTMTSPNIVQLVVQQADRQADASQRIVRRKSQGLMGSPLRIADNMSAAERPRVALDLFRSRVGSKQ
jgi:hypothetical protein